MTQQNYKEVDVTLKARISQDMYFVLEGATVMEGEYKGTSCNPSVGGGMPVIYVHKNGKSLGTFTIALQELLTAAITAVEKELGE